MSFESNRIPGGLLRLIQVVLVLALLWAVASYGIVPAGSRGVMTTFGKPADDVLDEDIHWRVPLAQRIHQLETRVQKSEGEGDAASKDLQAVHTRGPSTTTLSRTRWPRPSVASGRRPTSSPTASSFRRLKSP